MDQTIIIIIMVFVSLVCCCCSAGILAYFMMTPTTKEPTEPTTTEQPTTTTSSTTTTSPTTADMKKQVANPGDSIMCTGYTPKGEGAIYRYEGDNKMRHYPTGEIAVSWDPNVWNGNKKVDCTGITLGADMTKQVANPGDSIMCTGYTPKGEGAIYRYEGDNKMRLYPTGEIAVSWDPNVWNGNKKVDCTGITLGADMAKK
jgi:hypothetical protein